MGISFIKQDFISHSGIPLTFKIECDTLTDDEIELFAEIIDENVKFKEVYGIPRGGERLAKALEKYKDKESQTLLIVDDVITSGKSLQEAREKKLDEGWCFIETFAIFSRDLNHSYHCIMELAI
jgi:hypothetical protein